MLSVCVSARRIIRPLLAEYRIVIVLYYKENTEYTMTNKISKYFARELTFEEKVRFLSEINENEKLKKEFIEIQLLVAYLDLLHEKGDEAKARAALLRFMASPGR